MAEKDGATCPVCGRWIAFAGEVFANHKMIVNGGYSRRLCNASGRRPEDFDPYGETAGK